MKKILSIFLILCFVVQPYNFTAEAAELTVASVIYSEDFESAEGKEIPDGITVNGNSEQVYTDMVGTSKRLWLKNDNDISGVAVEKKFDAISNKVVSVSVDYLQIAKKVDGDKIISLNSGSTMAATIATKDGSIVYLTSQDGLSYKVIVSDYFINRAYKIELEADLVSQTCTVYVDGTQVGEYDFLNTISTVDCIRIESSYSPGFAVDNLKITTEETVSKMIIEGTKQPVIPEFEAQEYEYKAYAYDDNGVIVENVNINWSLGQAVPGVSLEKTGVGTAKLIVQSTAAEASFNINGEVEGSNGEIKGYLSVKTTPLKATKLDIIGWTDKAVILDEESEKSYIEYPSYRMHATKRETNTYQYTVKTYDQFGNEVANFGDFIWELFPIDGEIPACVTINSNTGLVMVDGDVSKEYRVGLRVKSKTDPNMVDEQQLLVSDTARYAADKERFDAVIGHIESVLKYASVEGTPLLSDLISSKTFRPAVVTFSAEDGISSNLMSQNMLMCSLENLTNMTGNPKYFNKVNEIYNYAMKNCVTENDALIWGGHMTMNLLTGKMIDDKIHYGTHEIKMVSPYITPLLREGVNFASPLINEGEEDTNGGGYGGLLIRSFIAGHAGEDFENLVFERHYYSNRGRASMEEQWKTPELFDIDRFGPVDCGTWGATFHTVPCSMVSILDEYFRATGDEYALEWAENIMASVLNSGYVYYVYTDDAGKLIYPSRKDDEGYRTFLNQQSELMYRSSKKDERWLWRDYSEPGDKIKVIDNNGNEVELTLLNKWSQGMYNDEVVTPKGNGGMEEQLPAIDAQYGRPWYEMPNYYDYSDIAYGDRLYNNWIYGREEDNAVYEGVVNPDDIPKSARHTTRFTEEEGDLCLSNLEVHRGIDVFWENEGYVRLIQTFVDYADMGDEYIEKARKYGLQYSKAAYNVTKLRYDEDKLYWNGYMSWMRPYKVRELGLTGLETDPFNAEEVPDDKTLRDDLYIYVGDYPSPHNGYYYKTGDSWEGDRTDLRLVINMPDAIYTLKNVADLIKDRYPEDAETLYRRCEYLWSVLRDICLNFHYLGDIGENMYDPQPDMDLGTTANLDSSSAYNECIILGMVQLYRITGKTEYLDFARAVANNYVSACYDKDLQMFEDGSEYFVSSTGSHLPALLKLESALIGRYDESITADPAVAGYNWHDMETVYYNNAIDYNQDMFLNPSSLYPNIGVSLRDIDIIPETIEVKVGESVEIPVEIYPFDAGTSFTWDVYDPSVAIVNSDTMTVTGKRPGTTKVRCVAWGGFGIDDEVTLIVK